MDLGSGVVAVGLSPTITRVAIPCRNGRVSGARKIPACVAQQLIPDQWWISAHASANDLGLGIFNKPQAASNKLDSD